MTRWILLALLLASCVLPPEGVNPVVALIVGELPVVIALWHFIAWAGWRMAITGFAVIYVVAYAFEFVGTHTGLIFGEYFYSPTAIGPLVAEVPILLPLGYFAMAYGALIVTRLILGNLNTKLSAIGVIITAFTSSLVMTFLDLASDPIAATLFQKWTWVDGGSYFGVPVHNYIGWVMTTFTFFLIVTILLNRDSVIHRCQAPKPRNFYAQAIVLYASFGITVVLNPILGRTGEIYDSMALVAGLVITVPVIAASVSLTRQATRA